MQIYECGYLNEEEGLLELDGKLFECKIGKHSIWVPALPGKIVWSHNGRVESIKDWNKGHNREDIYNGTFNEGCVEYDPDSIRSIIEEHYILQCLSKVGMAPDMAFIFYIKSFYSTKFPYGDAHCDPKGRYGY